MTLVNLEERYQAVETEKGRYAILFGLTAGIVFSLVTWGYDGLQLAGSHAMFPWMNFILGLIPTTLISGLVGWLVYRLNNHLIAFGLWLVTAIVFALLVGHVPFDMADRVLKIINPTVGAVVSYPFVLAVEARTFLVMIVIAILVVIGGMLEITLIDASVSSTPVVPLIIWFLFFGVAGIPAQNYLNSQLVDPVVNTDAAIQFAIDHQAQPVDKQTSLDMHLAAVKPLLGLADRPRKLILGGFDSILYNARVLVNFDGQWVQCSVVSNEPNVCDLVQYSDLLKPQ